MTGTIVRWHATVSPSTRIRLRVASPLAGSLTFIASGPIEGPLATSALDLPSSLPISIGDRIAVDLFDPNPPPGPSALRVVDGVPGAVYDSWQPGPPDGSSLPAPTPVAGTELLLNADVAASNQVAVAAVKRNTHKGTALLTINVPNAGKLVVGSPAGHKGLVKAQSLDVAAGAVGLVLRPTKRAKTLLAEKGKARGEVALTLTPSADPTAGTTDLKLKLKRKR